MRIKFEQGILIKKVLLSIFLFISTIYYSFSQENIFNLFYKDACNNQSLSVFNYYLEKNGVEFHPTLEGVSLKSMGEYNLIHERLIIPIIIDQKVNSYTINSSEITEFYVTHDKHGYIFRDCNSKLNGDIIDYYENQQIKLIGTFKKGLAIGYLIEFYPNGDLKEISHFDKKGFLVKKIVSN